MLLQCVFALRGAFEMSHFNKIIQKSIFGRRALKMQCADRVSYGKSLRAAQLSQRFESDFSFNDKNKFSLNGQ